MATSKSLNILKRWSCVDTELPSVESIKHLHVYDFDNTLFASPLPNRQVWQGPTIGMLQNQTTFSQGGWWHDANILKATGDGMEAEEARGWEGWWNEQVVNLVELSMQQKDALNVLLTGRTEAGFAEVVQRMVKSRNLHFDLIVLRPLLGPLNQQFTDTMQFKQVFLRDIIDTYSQADEIRLYEDRVKHVTNFRNFFDDIRHTLLDPPPGTDNPHRKSLKAEVIEVAENAKTLDPLTEIAEVQKMINTHNTAYASGTLPRNAKPYEIKRNVLYTGYLIKLEDTKRLLALAGINNATSEGSAGDWHTLASNIMITPRPCPPHILSKVGGLGGKFNWRAVALGSLDNKLWAMRVEPVPTTASYFSNDPIPMVVLATRHAARPVEANRIQRWKQLKEEEKFVFETEVSEKVLLRIEEEGAGGLVRRMGTTSGVEERNVYVNGNGKRARGDRDEENFPPLVGPAGKPAHQGRGGRHPPRQDFSDRGGSGRGRGRDGGGRGGGRGRGGGSGRGRGGFQGGGARHVGPRAGQNGNQGLSY